MQFKILGLLTLITSALAAPAALERRLAPNGGSWSITRFTRICSGGSGPNCQYSFDVAGSHVFYQDNGPPGKAIYQPLTGSFYGADVGGGYRLSWGYDPSGFAVLTLQNGPKVAWFGYDNVVAVSDPSKGGNGKFPDKTSPTWS